MSKFSDDTDNLEAKNLKYWGNFYAREGKLTLTSSRTKLKCYLNFVFQADKYQNVLRNLDFVKADLISSEIVDRRFSTLMSVLQKLETEEAIQDRYMFETNTHFSGIYV